MTKRVLIACEFSGIVREAFNSYHGVHAISCDIIPPEDGRVDYHHQGDVREILNDGWDMMLFFAPCTFLANSGVKHLYIDGKKENGINSERLQSMKNGAKFFNSLLDANIPLIAGENPIQHKHARKLIRKYDQIIQPYQFGHLEQKSTCLWLKGLPELIETNNVYDEMKKLPKREQQKVHYMSPSDKRGHERSRTYSGIAQAMAAQWVPILLGNSSTQS